MVRETQETLRDQQEISIPADYYLVKTIHDEWTAALATLELKIPDCLKDYRKD